MRHLLDGAVGPIAATKDGVMDLLKTILDERGGDLIKELTDRVGITQGQAERFVPDAGSQVIAALTKRPQEFDLANPAADENVAAVLGGLDIPALASRAGISADQGERGLATMVPMLLKLFGDSDSGGGLMSVLQSGEGVADALGKLRGLGGKLFG